MECLYPQAGRAPTAPSYTSRSDISSGKNRGGSGRKRSTVPLVKVDDLLTKSKIIFHCPI